MNTNDDTNHAPASDRQPDLRTHRQQSRAKAHYTRLTIGDLLSLLDVPLGVVKDQDALASDAGATLVTHPDAGTLILAIGNTVHCGDGIAEVADLNTTDVTLRFRKTGHLQTRALAELIFEPTFYVIE